MYRWREIETARQAFFLPMLLSISIRLFISFATSHRKAETKNWNAISSNHTTGALTFFPPEPAYNMN